MKVIFLIYLVLFMVSCATPKKKIYIGESEETIVKDLGEPTLVRRTPAGEKVIYYDKKWYQVRNGKAVMGRQFDPDEYVFNVKSLFDSTYKNKLNGQTFAIYSGMRHTQSNDIEFKRITRALEHILRLSGMHRNSSGSPNYVFLISYGISDPIEDISVSYMPTFSWVPGQTTTTSGQIGGTSFTAQSTSQGYSQKTGHIPIVKRTINYNRFLMIDAFEHSTDLSKAPHVWKLSLQSIGYSDELKSILGVMFGVAQDWAFKESRGTASVSAPKNDPMASLAFPE